MLNAKEITIHEGAVEMPDGRTIAVEKIVADEEGERVALALPAELPTGQATLRLTFTGRLSDLSEAIEEARADAVLVASLFHYGEYRVREAKEHLRAAGIPVRI